MEPASARTEILAVANRQHGRPEEQIIALLENEWELAGLAQADRGGREYLTRVKNDIVTRVLRERDTTAVLTGLIAEDAIRWASEQGLPLEKYSFPIGLLVAWATLSASRALKSADSSARPEVEESENQGSDS